MVPVLSSHRPGQDTRTFALMKQSPRPVELLMFSPQLAPPSPPPPLSLGPLLSYFNYFLPVHLIPLTVISEYNDFNIPTLT